MPELARSTPPAPASPTTRPSRFRRTLGVVATWPRRLVAVVAFLAVWELVPRAGLVDRVFLPPFSQVVAAWWQLVGNGQMATNVEASMARSLSGLLLAVLVAVPLGVAIGWYEVVADVLEPLLELFRNTSALALLPVFVLLLGLGESSKVALVCFACCWPILLNTVGAVRGVDPLLIKAARSLGLPAPDLFAKIVLPASVPALFTGIRLAAAYSILVLLAAELTGAKAGLGFQITSAQYNFRIPQMYAGIVTISLLGLVLNQVLVVAERRLSRSRPVR